jgi:beta-xylosidase
MKGKHRFKMNQDRPGKFVASVCAVGLGVVVAASVLALPQASTYFTDIFSSTTLGTMWRWEREVPSAWSLTDNPGYLRIDSAAGGFLGDPPPPQNVLLTTISPDIDCRIEVHLYFRPTEDFQYAGVVFYVDPDNFLAFGRAFCDYVEGGCVGDGIYIDHEEEGEYQSQPPIIAWSGDDIYFRVFKVGNKYTFSVSHDGQEWIDVGEKRGVGLRPVAVGLYAVNATDEANSIPADFDYFRMSPPIQ